MPTCLACAAVRLHVTIPSALCLQQAVRVTPQLSRGVRTTASDISRRRKSKKVWDRLESFSTSRKSSSLRATTTRATEVRHQALTLLHKATNFLPRALSPKDQALEPSESLEFWNDLLVAAYDDLTLTVGAAKARIAGETILFHKRKLLNLIYLISQYMALMNGRKVMT